MTQVSSDAAPHAAKSVLFLFDKKKVHDIDDGCMGERGWQGLYVRFYKAFMGPDMDPMIYLS